MSSEMIVKIIYSSHLVVRNATELRIVQSFSEYTSQHRKKSHRDDWSIYCDHEKCGQSFYTSYYIHALELELDDNGYPEIIKFFFFCF